MLGTHTHPGTAVKLLRFISSVQIRQKKHESHCSRCSPWTLPTSVFVSGRRKGLTNSTVIDWRMLHTRKLIWLRVPNTQYWSQHTRASIQRALNFARDTVRHRCMTARTVDAGFDSNAPYIHLVRDGLLHRPPHGVHCSSKAGSFPHKIDQQVKH